nr:DNA translocase FtsK 4TM domain-containing protein [Mannheimia granulomatis]
MIEQLKPHLKGKENLIKLMLILTCCFGIYLLIAWASYSPLDNSWSSASSVTTDVLNKAGSFGAWSIDMLYAMFGKAAVVIPFSLIISSIYMLGMGLSNEITWKIFLFRFASFLLLMLGLAGLFSVLLSNSAYYLSGGFIGGVWQTILADSLGQFGALLIAMIFTVVGLYFCSVHSLWPILAQFYEWVMAKTEESKEASTPTVNMQNLVENQPLVEEGEAKENNELAQSSKLTDISAFKRPNISGLKQTSDAEKFTDAVNADNPEMYNIEPNLPLPKVNIASQFEEPTQGMAEIAIEQPEYPPSAANHELSLPTIRLNSATEQEIAFAPLHLVLN